MLEKLKNLLEFFCVYFTLVMKKKETSCLPTELLVKTITYIGINKIKKLFPYKSVYSLVRSKTELWNTFAKAKSLTIDECLNILKNRSLLLKSIKQEHERVTTFNTMQADMTKLSFFNNNIYVSSDDHTVKCFDFNGTCLKKYTGHTGGIWTFDFLKDRLVTGSVDRTARIWDSNKEVALRTLKYHRSTIRVLKVYQDYIITGSRDFTIGVWNSQGDILYRLEGHADSVRALDIDEDFLISGSYDGSCKLWDYKKGKFIRDIHKHGKRLYCVKMYGGYVASAGLDTGVKISRLDGTLSRFYNIHRGCIGWLHFEENYIISISNDGCIVKFDYINNELVYRFEVEATIRDAKVTDTLILIASINEARVYSLKTGNLIRTLLKASSVVKIDMIDWKIVVGFHHNNVFKLSVFDYYNNKLVS